MLFGLFTRRRDPTADHLYRLVVEQSRAPVFYTDFAVPDTVEGRFELIVAHCGLLVARLGRDAATRPAGRALAETFFRDMDDVLRETGVSDVAVPKKMRRIADAFYGRLGAYEAAANGPALVAAVARNVYDGAPPAGAAEDLAAYLKAAMAALEAADPAALAAGAIPWPQPLRRVPAASGGG